MNLNFSQTDFDQEERDAVNKVLSGTWLASGPENESFEKEFAEYVGTKHAVCVNSGSSANLLSLASLKLARSSSVLTSACGFPATLAPIIHLGLKPILVDYDINTHNIDLNQVFEKRNEIQAIIFAHTLGNPVNEDLIALAQSLGIPIIEDCCEAVGSKLNDKHVGSIGTLGTYSFYPAHQMTACGGGGMVVTNDKYLAREIRSMRDWGKVWDWDDHLGDNTTKWTSPIDDLLYYKHYTYMNVGWNFKLPEVCAAFGRVQIKRLDKIRERRIENYEYLSDKLSKLDDIFIRVKPIEGAFPSWFGYPLTLRNSGFNLRNQLGDWLESKGIRIRPFFAGNITRHEPFKQFQGNFPVADKLMKDSLFFGCGQWMGKKELDFIVETIESWILSQSAF